MKNLILENTFSWNYKLKKLNEARLTRGEMLNKLRSKQESQHQQYSHQAFLYFKETNRLHPHQTIFNKHDFSHHLFQRVDSLSCDKPLEPLSPMRSRCLQWFDRYL